METIQSPFLKKKEAAKLLKVSTATLANYVNQGLIGKYKIGNQFLYKQEEINAALEKLQTQHNVQISEILASNSDLMTITDAAKYLKLSETTIKNYLKQKILRKHQYGKVALLKLSEVNASIQKITSESSNYTEQQNPITQDDLSVNEVSRLLGITTPMVNTLASMGLLRKHNINGKIYLKRKEVEQAQNKVKELLGT